MACGKRKSLDDNNSPLSDCKIPTHIESDGIIVVHRYNLSIVAECKASSINNCIQAPIVIDGDGNKEDHILSSFQSNQTGQYHIIKSAA